MFYVRLFFLIRWLIKRRFLVGALVMLEGGLKAYMRYKKNMRNTGR
jgi:hypothetical protein